MSNNLAGIERDPNYQELVRRRSSLGWMLSLMMLIVYFGFILLVAFDKPLLAMKVGTTTSLGIVLAFVLTGIYVRRANSSYDGLIRKIIEENR